MAENRLRPRKPNRHITQVFDCVSDQVVGRLANISTEGMMLIAQRPYEKGAVCQLRLPLPRMVMDKTEMEVEAEVRWCKRDSNPAFWGIGLKFTSLNHEDIRIIDEEFGRISLVG